MLIVFALFFPLCLLLFLPTSVRSAVTVSSRPLLSQRHFAVPRRQDFVTACSTHAKKRPWVNMASLPHLRQSRQKVSSASRNKTTYSPLLIVVSPRPHPSFRRFQCSDGVRGVKDGGTLTLKHLPPEGSEWLARSRDPCALLPANDR